MIIVMWPIDKPVDYARNVLRIGIVLRQASTSLRILEPRKR